MAFVENLIIDLIKAIAGDNKIEYQGKKISLKKPFKRATYRDIIRKYTGMDIFKYKDTKSLMAKINNLKIKGWDIVGTPTWPKLVDELFKEKVRDNLIEPIFVINHPVELSPLSKRRKENSDEVERFQLYIGGIEMMNGFSELNDPEDQRQRFEDQARLRKTGDEEAMIKDNEFIEALEYGMPPTAGLGMGIDRLVMLLTDQKSIREVILFPQLRVKE
jgi:lysyl-tRNA synthetase class 2